MIACLTGAILVFEKELQEIFNRDRYYVQPQGRRMALEEIVAAVNTQYPDAKIAGIKVYTDKERSTEVGLVLPEKEKKE